MCLRRAVRLEYRRRGRNPLSSTSAQTTTWVSLTTRRSSKLQRTVWTNMATVSLLCGSFLQQHISCFLFFSPLKLCSVLFVRFICGTQDIHKQLEKKIADFHGKQDSILYASCFDANGGIFEALLGAEDAVISDELNHASIIGKVSMKSTRRSSVCCVL